MSSGWWQMGWKRDPSIRRHLQNTTNARVTEAGNGAGVYEAVVSTLMGPS